MDTLSEVMNRLNQEGYRGNIHIEDLKLLRPSDWVIDDIFRFEGFTNPSDNSILYAISKKDGSQKTLLVNAYGMDSEEEINSFVDQVTGSEG
ncbi:phosphoribosylpyrophosphate synthetase [Flavobacterium orientale]|uniref:Phosphoribosylpyrophosphate synthetase n=1 Tax=Flavobacterium orientale TaxID=1756020 RepID=A0A916Y9V3_9FLAO|nr:phosphoribosylpyrophosphate synthetase [Flavobacterium orientale]GGD36181.1 hypothetical protein GCM10011343_27530 [Flavobacterium orientale]